MGTTLPLIAPFLYSKKDEVSQKLPALYAVNTFGAWLGCLLASFFFLPNLGYFGTIQLAAVINIGLYLIVRSITGPQLPPSQINSVGLSLNVLWFCEFLVQKSSYFHRLIKVRF